MSLKTISPQDAAKLIREGAVLVDIREADERAREKIPGAEHMPLSQLDQADMSVHSGRPVIFHCRSGMRTLANAETLGSKAQGQCDAYVVEGGLEAWKKAGLPVATDRSKPIEIQRQVQIIAGSLGLIGTLLGVFIHPGFLVIPAFIGAGLTFAGATGFCGMAIVLARAPWNRALRNA
jgi:rhodanese-related sulfurtransferase